MTVMENAGRADYPPEWKDGTIQRRIRERAGFTCEICGLKFDPLTNAAIDTVDESGQSVHGHVHHLDHFPPNCADENLIFLCQRCHFQLHGWGWKPGDVMPISWGNEPPAWVVRRGLPVKLNPMVASWHESARYATRREEQIAFIINLVESQGWVSGAVNPLAEMREFLISILVEYERFLDRRTQNTRTPVLEQAAAWAAQCGLVEYQEAVSISGLAEFDFQFALAQGIIAPETCPFQHEFIPQYFDPAKLRFDESSLRELWSQAQISRIQASDLLGIPIAVFERRRREVGIRRIGTVKTESGWRDHLYRRIDIEKLRR